MADMAGYAVTGRCFSRAIPAISAKKLFACARWQLRARGQQDVTGWMISNTIMPVTLRTFGLMRTEEERTPGKERHWLGDLPTRLGNGAGRKSI